MGKICENSKMPDGVCQITLFTAVTYLRKQLTAEYQDGDACRSPHADGIAQYHGKSPKTDHITERINLDSEAFFIFSAVLFHTGHLAVEHVAQTGERQTEQSVFCKSLEGENHAYGRGSQSQICQYNRVAVKSYHKI